MRVLLTVFIDNLFYFSLQLVIFCNDIQCSLLLIPAIIVIFLYKKNIIVRNFSKKYQGAKVRK